MSTLRFALICWLLALTCAFFYISNNSTLISLSLNAVYKDLIFCAVVTSPLLLAAFGIKQRHEERVTKEQTLKKSADKAAEQVLSTSKTTTFDYRPSRLKFVLLALVFPFLTYAIFYALTQEAADLIQPKNRTASAIFYCFFLSAAGCFMFYYSLVFLATARRAFGDKYQLSITQDQISFPLKPYSAKAESIKLTDLERVYVHKDQYDNKTLELKHNRGTSVLLPGGFASEEAFQLFAALAAARQRNVHQDQAMTEFFVRVLEGAPADIAEELLADETPEQQAKIKTLLREKKPQGQR